MKHQSVTPEAYNKLNNIVKYFCVILILAVIFMLFLFYKIYTLPPCKSLYIK